MKTEDRLTQIEYKVLKFIAYGGMFGVPIVLSIILNNVFEEVEAIIRVPLIVIFGFICGLLIFVFGMIVESLFIYVHKWLDAKKGP